MVLLQILGHTSLVVGDLLNGKAFYRRCHAGDRKFNMNLALNLTLHIFHFLEYFLEQRTNSKRKTKTKPDKSLSTVVKYLL